MGRRLETFASCSTILEDIILNQVPGNPMISKNCRKLFPVQTFSTQDIHDNKGKNISGGNELKRLQDVCCDICY